MRRTRLYALALLTLIGCGVPAGCSGGVVGGECRHGFDACSGHCIDPLTDALNCGRCDNACADGMACSDGICGGADASTGNGSGGNSETGGATGGRAGASNGGASNGGASNGGASTDAGERRDASREGGTLPDASVEGGLPDGATGGAPGSPSDAGTAGSGGTSGGGSAGVSASGGNAGNAGNGGNAGNAGSAGTTTDAGPVCTTPYDTSAHCGSCDNACPPDAPLCSNGRDGYFCTPLCNPPLVACGTQCVNLDSDENNCGRCGRRCASGICQGGQCVGATAGHEITFCMDFRTAAGAGTPPEQLLENAVFVGSKANVRILGYTENATPAVTTVVNATLTTAAQNRGRAFTLTASTSSLDVANELNVTKFDVLLVYDQPAAPAGRLAVAGTSMADAVDAFVHAGGVVVVLAGDTGRGEMAAFVTALGVLPVSGQTLVTGSLLYDRGPADAIGVNVLSPFRAPNVTCRFATTAMPDDTTVFVVTDSPSSSGTLGAPVVVHRVIAP
ncbi:MAG TPA: hypothetical protein VH062_12930 [Polyangiaceae bacterium]|jgi:hypothetical protein|nr:hypothetical protein [Polyangiaceae bacterium]